MAMPNSYYLEELQQASSYLQKSTVRRARDTWNPVLLLYSPVNAFALEGRVVQGGVGDTMIRANPPSRFRVAVGEESHTD